MTLCHISHTSLSGVCHRLVSGDGRDRIKCCDWMGDVLRTGGALSLGLVGLSARPCFWHPCRLSSRPINRPTEYRELGGDDADIASLAIISYRASSLNLMP